MEQPDDADLVQVSLVRQEHDYGCGVACLAMVTGHTYADIHAECVKDWPNSERGLNLAERGLYSSGVEWYLATHGYCWRYVYSAWRLSEWPPLPFAPVHIASVVQPSGNSHYVVMTPEGVVLDPLTATERRLTDWEKVNNVMGIWTAQTGS